MPDADYLDRADERYRWVGDVVEAAVEGTGETRPTRSDRIDRWITSPVVGPVLPALIVLSSAGAISRTAEQLEEMRKRGSTWGRRFSRIDVQPKGVEVWARIRGKDVQ